MPITIRVNHKDEGPQPWQDKQSLDLAELAAVRDYTLKHPFFPVLLRARQADGRGRNQYYNPAGEVQLCREGKPWPMRWLETSDLAGTIHEFGFDADVTFPRGPEAYAVFRGRLKRAMWRLGIEEPADSTLGVDAAMFGRE